MSTLVAVGLVSILLLGIGAQWLAWWLRLPAILLLLVAGVIAGPVTGLINPDALFGDLLDPIVSLSVALILFEGGLSLRLAELRDIRGVVQGLLSAGVIVTWTLTAVAAYFLLKLDIGMSILLGAMLVVTGPTVIGPLLRQVRPIPRVGSILKWESIFIDPIGAILAIVIYQAVSDTQRQFHNHGLVSLAEVLRTLSVGVFIGIIGAGVLLFLLKRYLIPDFLQNPVTLMVVLGTATASSQIQPESGLLAATIMGVLLANQKLISVRHIISLEEDMTVLLVSSLFIVLAARLQLAQLLSILNLGSLFFLLALLLVVRPAAVALASIRSGLRWRERIFLAWMAPRGIVAASVSAIFAQRLVSAGYAQGALLAPITFMVIIWTVVIYGFTATSVARWLRVSQPTPRGFLLLGAQNWARAIGSALQAEGLPILLIGANPSDLAEAQAAGLPIYYGSILKEGGLDETRLAGIGRLLAMTPSGEFNSLAVMHYSEVFGRVHCYQLQVAPDTTSVRAISPHLQGRPLFRKDLTFAEMTRRFDAGAVIKKITLAQEGEYHDLLARYGEHVIPLFLINSAHNLSVFAADNPPRPRPGDTLIALVDPLEEGSAPALMRAASEAKSG
jgi:NhaP-type Na+/H+ or K+/H+ antiporter